MSVNTELQSGVQLLWDLSPDELELELGRRLAQTREDLAQGDTLTAARPMGPSVDHEKLMALPQSVRQAAGLFLDKFNREMYSLVCDEKDPDHDTIKKAAVKGADALGYALAGAFVATFGWLPGIATVIAVIVAKRAGKAGYEAMCSTWKKQL